MLDGMSDKLLPEMLEAHVVGSIPSKGCTSPAPRSSCQAAGEASGSHNLLFGDFQTHETGIVTHSEFAEILGNSQGISETLEEKLRQCAVFQIMLSEIKERNTPQNKYGKGMISEEAWIGMGHVLRGIISTIDANIALASDEMRAKGKELRTMLQVVNNGQQGDLDNTLAGMQNILTKIIDSIMTEDCAQPVKQVQMLSKPSEAPPPPPTSMVLNNEPIVVAKHKRVKNNYRIPVIQEIVSECKVKFPNATDTVANRKAIHRFGSQFCEHHGMRTQHIRAQMPLVVELVLTPDKWEIEAQTAANTRFIKTRRGARLSLWHRLLNYIEGVGNSVPIIES